MVQVHTDYYASWGDAVRAASAGTHSSHREGDSGWTGTPDWATAEDLALNGWADVRPNVDRQLSELEAEIDEVYEDTFTTRMDYGGSFVDMDRYLSGDPECMVEYVSEPQARQGRVVRILVNMCASSAVRSEVMIARGVAVTALVGLIHRMKCGVEVYLEYPISLTGAQRGADWSALVKVHDSSETLDINNLMFAICNPSSLRRVGFGLAEVSPWSKAARMYQGSYGYPARLASAERVGADVTVELAQSAGDYGDGWTSNPRKWIVETVTGLGLV